MRARQSPIYRGGPLFIAIRETCDAAATTRCILYNTTARGFHAHMVSELTRACMRDFPPESRGIFGRIERERERDTRAYPIDHFVARPARSLAIFQMVT